MGFLGWLVRQPMFWCAVVYVLLGVVVLWGFVVFHEEANQVSCKFAGGVPSTVYTPFSSEQLAYTSCAHATDLELWRENGVADGVNNQLLYLGFVVWAAVGFLMLLFFAGKLQDMVD